MDKNNSLGKYNHSLDRVGKLLDVTKKLLAKNDDHFLIPYRKGDKWGFCDRNKRIIIACVYEFIYPFSEGLAEVVIKHYFNDCPNDDRYIFLRGFINKIGEIIIPCIYDMAEKFNEGLAHIKRGSWQFIDKTGKEIITL